MTKGAQLINTGATRVTGNVAAIMNTIIGFDPPGTVGGINGEASGTQTSVDNSDLLAYNQAQNAYNQLAILPYNVDMTSLDLGNRVLTAGVYKYTSAAQLTGTLTLSGTATDVFVFQIGTALTTGTAAQIVLNGVRACNVFFQIGSSATLGTGTIFNGNIIASQSITLGSGSTVTGSLFALVASINLATNTIITQVCPLLVFSTTAAAPPAATVSSTAIPVVTSTIGVATTSAVCIPISLTLRNSS